MTHPEQDLPPYDIKYIQAQPFAERLRLICRTWLFQEAAPPAVVYLGYVAKIALLFVGGWWIFCLFTPGMGSPSTFTTWAFTPVAFQKFVLWAFVYESLGLGCSTGPMTGRFVPPIGGVLFFARTGTVKLPMFPGLPVLGGDQRRWFDVAMYAVIHLAALRALVAPAITPEMLAPIIVLLPVAALSDKTIFLSARGEHYYTALVCIWYMDVSGDAWIGGTKMIWVAIWFWAATSKLNHHFPGVVSVMLTNSPLVPAWFHRRLYKSFPDDARPSALASTIAHTGTAIEYTFPLLLLAAGDGPWVAYALALMVAFHCFIAFNFPMGMPVEWNVLMVYGGFFLFGAMGEVPIATVWGASALLKFLLIMLIAIPLYGNFAPAQMSFLMAMRYYAGNWAYSVWLFEKGSERKLDVIKKPVPLLRDQLNRIIEDPDQVEMAIAMQPSFRLQHLQGRVLHFALPKAVDNIENYEWCDGEMVAGMVVGWNFGDGHLHDEQLLESIQRRCGFEPGELRVVIVESQPLGSGGQRWRVVDAATGPVASGYAKIADMMKLQPWPTGAQAAAFVPADRIDG